MLVSALVSAALAGLAVRSHPHRRWSVRVTTVLVASLAIVAFS